MRDCIFPVRKKVYELLSAQIPSPVYYKYLPNSIKNDSYVLISAITGTDDSTMQSHDQQVSLQYSIYTKEPLGNEGLKADTLADMIYRILYPNPGFVIDLPTGFQNTGIQLINDVSPDALLTQSFVFINRFITLRYKVYINDWSWLPPATDFGIFTEQFTEQFI